MSEYLPLGECCNHILDFRGRTPLKLGMDWGGGNIPALSANNVKDGYIDFQKECNVGSDDLYRAWMTRGDCRKGDILFTMEAPMGNVAQVPDNGKYILSQRVILISPKSKVVCGNYLFHFLRSDEFRKQCDYLATGTTAKGIKQANLVGIEIPIPPLPEQKKIAEILSGIDNGIAALKQSKRIRMAAHEQAMAEFINKSMGTTQDLEEMGYEVLDGDRGDAYPKEKDFNSNGYCLFLSAKNVTKSGFNFGSCQYISREKDCEMRKGRLERGDIVITTRGTLGNIAYFDDSIPIRTMRINSGMAIIRARASKNSGKEEFLLSCLLSDFVQNQIRKASFGTAQNQLTLGIIKRLRFPVLSIANEILFTKQCNALSSYGKKLQEGIGKREHLKQTIASDLLSGRMRVSI